MPVRRRTAAPPHRRARRRRRLALWVLCVVLLLAPRGDSVRSLSAEVSVAVAPIAPPALHRESSAPSVDPPEPAPEPLGPQERDRCWGALAAARHDLQGGRFSAAIASLEVLGSLARDVELDRARAALERDLEAELVRWMASLDDLLGDGHAPAAAQRLALACGPAGHRRVVERVNAWARARGWPILLDVAPVSHSLSTASPLPEGAELRVWFEDRWADASVASGAADAVTVRVVTPQGVVFPTLARESVAPASVEFAGDQARAALAAENWSLAALWCAVSLRAARPLDPELAQAVRPWFR